MFRQRKIVVNKKVVAILISVGIVVIAGLTFGTLCILDMRSYTSADFGFQDQISAVDYDGDGIEDYADMMMGARKYIAKHPEYESKYYPKTGYPTDNKGVCTDVIWSALKAAGYDFRKMMSDDILTATDEYGIHNPNKNIDFRRVKNIHTYLKRNARELTADVSDAGAFQYGDIVIFGEDEHIAILSDKRNRDGLPYLIHHSVSNGAVEEDVMKKMTVTAHFRFDLQAGI